MNLSHNAMTKERTSQRICPQCGEDFAQSMDFCPEDGTRLRAISIRTSTDDDDPLLGQDIDGRFHVERVLGEGGMGRVYGGKQLSVNREVAIKVLRAELASDEKIVRRFFREAQVISQFSHPNIVSLVDFGQDVERDVLYLAMEFIDGTELSDLMKHRRLVPALAVDVLIQTCEALSEPHALGVTHRDLKPENLMLLPRADGRVQAKVVDFGIAHAIQHQTKLTQTGSVFGTAHYMAPEQAQGNEVGAHTDIYALGCILFELLTGSVPFDGDTAMQLLMAHVQGDPPVLAHILPGGDEIDALSELVLLMLRKEGAQRPESVLEVRDRLESIQRQFDLPRVRVKTDVSPEEMFEPWLLEPVDMDAAGSAPVDRATNAPLSAHQTGETDLNRSVSDNFSAADQFAETMAPGIGNTAEVTPEDSGAFATRTAGAPHEVSSTDKMTDMTDIAVAPTDRYKKLLIPAAGVTLAALLVAGLAVALVISGGGDTEADESALSGDEAGAAELTALAEDEDQPPEEMLGEDLDEVGEKEDEVAEVEEEEAAEEEAEEEEAAQEEEAEEEEIVEQPEPEPAARPEPRPEPRPRPRPQPTPQPEPEEEEEDSRPRLEIFTVD